MIFEIDRVTYKYQQQVALDGLTLNIAEGTRTALLGANGSGKSTLLRLLDGLVFPESGEVALPGNRTDRGAFWQRCICSQLSAASRHGLPEP